MKLSLGLSTLGGLLLALALIGAEGFGAVTEAILAAEWGLLGVILLHLVPLIFSGLAWHSLLSGIQRSPVNLFIQARWIREGVNDLLPVAQIGGHVAGARFLTLHGVKAGLAGASVVVDVTLRLLAQLLFTAFGVALLLSNGNQNSNTVKWWIGGVLVAGLCLLGFILAQRWGVFQFLETGLQAITRRWDLPSWGKVLDLHGAIQLLYHNPSRLVLSGGYHFCSLVAGTLEVWVLFYFMGQSINIWEAFLLESLGQAVRTIGFAVPGALGVQEGGFVLLGGLLGISPATSLGLSLVKRMRDVVLGLPALLVWQLREGQHHLQVLCEQRKYSPSLPSNE